MSQKNNHGIFPRGKVLYIRYYHPILKKPVTESTDIPDTKQGYKDALELKNEKIKNLRKQRNIRKYVPLFQAVKMSQCYDIIKENMTLKDKSMKSIKYTIDYFIEACGDHFLGNYTPMDVDKYRVYLEKKKKFSPNSIALSYRTLKGVFSKMIKWDYLQKNPVIGKLKGEKKLIKIFSDKEILQLLKYLKEVEINEDYYNIINFMYLSGLRKGEAISMDWKQIDMEKGLYEIWNEKENRWDHIPMLPPLISHLQSMAPKKEGPLFPTVQTVDSFSFYFKAQEHPDVFKEIRYTVHELRKTFITTLFRQKMPIDQVQLYARHQDIKTTIEFYNAINHLYLQKANKNMKFVSLEVKKRKEKSEDQK